ncbi:MAG: class I tRNA ligase family protein [Moraxellaceae bacterium]|nr:class I tRNA ligase family protein [Moraxellaceae bacterium]
MSRYLVTITPPTPNGDLHLGHISGPFLAADVFKKAKILQGNEVLLISYSDDHQSYMARKAREQDRNVLELASENAALIEKSMQAMHIDCDFFMRSGNNGFFAASVQRFFDAAVQRGLICEAEVSVPYDDELGTIGYEAYARGQCSDCGYPTDLSQCENCACTPDPSLTKDIHSPVTKRPLPSRPMRRLALDIDKIMPVLVEHYAQRPPERLLADFIVEHADRKGQKWCFDRNGDAGIPVLYQGNTVVVSTWFAGIAGYHAALCEYAYRVGDMNLVQEFWAGDTRHLVHFLGYDCSYSHAIAYPGLLWADTGKVGRVSHFTNAFLKLDGLDFSTSRNYAVWVRDIVQEHDPDVIRLYLALFSPEESPENFDQTHFGEWARNSSGLFARIAAALLYQPDPEAAFSGNAAMVSAWRAATGDQGFSMKRCAVLQMELLRGIERALDLGLDVSAVVFVAAVLGYPLHPRLSIQLLQRFQLSLEDAIDMLQRHSGAAVVSGAELEVA